MSSGMIGALVGLVVAIVDLFLLRLLATRVSLPETRKVLNVTGFSQLLLLPAAGWLVGHYVFGD
jgi:nucleoside recognition membrane protein YjiH